MCVPVDLGVMADTAGRAAIARQLRNALESHPIANDDNDGCDIPPGGIVLTAEDTVADCQG